MIYEGQVTYASLEDKVVKESYVIEEAANFTDAEVQLTQHLAAVQDLDVVALKRSKIKEIANIRTDEREHLWVAEWQDSFVDEDSGETKYTRYKVLFYATTFEMAKRFICEYGKQGYDLELVSLKMTKFIDVL